MSNLTTPLQISGLFIYPIKSLAAISLNEAQVTDRGLQYDRRWMLVDEQNVFLSQRELPAMVFFDVEIAEDGLMVTYQKDGTHLTVPFTPLKNDLVSVTVWDDTCEGLVVSDTANTWFTEKLGFNCRLIYMPDESHRLVDERYAKTADDITSFSDAYPILLIGQASLDDLNNRLTESLPMDRFRPNIVFTGGEPYREDGMTHFTINGINFYGVKPCARCVVTTTSQTTGKRAKEPLKTLATYRRNGNKILFGQNLLHDGAGVIRVGDSISLINQSEPSIKALPAQN